MCRLICETREYAGLHYRAFICFVDKGAIDVVTITLWAAQSTYNIIYFIHIFYESDAYDSPDIF